MKKTKIGSNATFVGGSPSASYVGDSLYSYSGAVAVGSSETTLVNFMTNKSYIKAEWRGVYIGSTNADYRRKLYFNNVPVEQLSATSKYETNIPRKLIIPPLTNVKITGENIEDSSTNDVGSILVGRIY